jgi:hypothetical protein
MHEVQAGISRSQGAAMAWFSKKPPWEVRYAKNIYDGMVAHNDIGGMTALAVRIPRVWHRAFQDKALLQRELICLAALTVVARPETLLQPVIRAFGTLIVEKASARGLRLSRDQLASHALKDADSMTSEPVQWAKRWLAQFMTDPNDNRMVEFFADYCTRLFRAYTEAIESTRPKWHT